MGDGDSPTARRPARSLRIPLLVLSFGLLASFVVLQGQEAVLVSMAPGGCEAAGPAAIQGGFGTAGEADVVEIVTGWHAFTQASFGNTVDAAGQTCTSIRDRVGDTQLLELNSAHTAATAWWLTDTFAFVPLYGTLLVVLLAWARRLDPPPPRPSRWLAGRDGGDDAEGPEVALVRGALWLADRRWLPALVVVAVLADLAENVLFLRHLDRWFELLDTSGVLFRGDLDVGLARAFGVVKWIALALPVLVAVILGARQFVRAMLLLGRSLRVLWVQGLLVGLFAIGVIVPAQMADAVRRLSVAQWFLTVLVVAGFATVVALSGAGVLKPAAPTPPEFRDAEMGDRPSTARTRPGFGSGASRRALWRALRPGLAVASVGVLVAVGGALVGFRGLYVLAAIIIAIGLASALLDVLARVFERAASLVVTGERVGRVREQVVRTEPGRVAPCLGAVPIAALGIVTLRATAADLVVLGPGQNNLLLLRLIVGIALTIAAGLTPVVLRRFVRAVERLDDRARRMILAAIAVLHVPGILFHRPDVVVDHAHRLGSIALLALFLSGLALIGSIAAWTASTLMSWEHTRELALPSALRVFRLRTTPVMGLLLVWALLVGVVDHHEHHRVRRVEAERPAVSSVRGYAEQWAARQPDDGPRAVPALVVAASGGGIRAAYWTGAVLDCVVERDGPITDPCAEPADPATIARRRSSLLVMSGISGGSLGLMSYVTAVGEKWPPTDSATPLPPEWYDIRLGDDYLAPVVATWLFNDVTMALLRPTDGVDRAAILERSWEASWDAGRLGEPFYSHQTSGAEPLLLLNGYGVEDGCRVLVSGIRSDRDRRATDCNVVASGSDLPVLLATADLVGQLCPDQDIRRSTAALASARFPFVSPAGHLEDCDGGDALEIVDGGYRETSGASPVVELWPELSEALAYAIGAGRCLEPTFVQIDNGYASDQLQTERGTVGQLLAPLVGLRNSSSGHEVAAREAARQLFRDDGEGWFRLTTRSHPGSTAPLGWVLSSDAKDDLQRQLKVNGEMIVAIRDRIDSPGTCP